jgi:transposase
MARPRRIDSDLVVRAQTVVARTQNARELRAAQAVLLPALANLTLEQTARVLGVARRTVARLQRLFRRQIEPGAPSTPCWGGRRRALLTQGEEQEFLAAWKPTAEQGQLVVLAPLRAALEKKLGRPAKPSVAYRLLERHHWRKVAPDTRHPKAEPSVQEEWKKKRFRKTWRPC